MPWFYRNPPVLLIFRRTRFLRRGEDEHTNGMQESRARSDCEPLVPWIRGFFISGGTR